MQRRKGERYRLEVPVKFSWEDRHGIVHRATGSTQDISTAGAFVRARHSPPPGSRFEVQLFLPPLAPGQQSLTLQGNARVLRVEHGQARSRPAGFAMLGEGLVLRDQTARRAAGAKPGG